MKVIVGISGASGVIYGIRLLDALRQSSGVETHLVLSATAKLNIVLETEYQVSQVEEMADQVHSDRNLAASISSGSFRNDAMVVAPCSMKSLSAIVNSYSDTLLTRAADVTLKDRRPLILVPRETPLHLGHCKLLYDAARLGAIIAPPMPAFYNKPVSVDDIVDHTVGRLMDLLGLDSTLARRWEGAGQS
jgi:4-hydroxy-3-polyprenylbenzoate decarboxylase